VNLGMERTSVLVSLILACITHLRHFQAEVSLPNGLQSYEQLASELTKDGIRTRCDARIRWRYALIRVPPMPWVSLRPILEKALDIRFEMGPDAVLDLKRDPEVASLEESLFRRFSRKFDQTVSDAVQSGWSIHEKMANEASVRNGADSLENMLESIRSLPQGNPNRNALNVALSINDDSQANLALSELWDGVDLSTFVKSPQVSVLTPEDSALWRPPDNPFGRSLPTASKVFGLQRGRELSVLAPAMIDSWILDPKWFFLAHDFLALFSVFDPVIGKDQTPIMPDKIGFECTWDDLYRGLSQQTSFRKRVASNQLWMSTDSANKTFTLPMTESSVSSVFDQWSRATDRPVVMEVTPIRESLGDEDQHKSIKLTLYGFTKGIAEEDIIPSCLRSPWSVREMDGITIVHDEFSFSDHVLQPNPLAAIKLSQLRRDSKDGANSLADLLVASRLVNADDDAAAVRTGLYSGLRDFPWIDPYLRLIQSDPTTLKGFEQLTAGQAIDIPMSKFPAEARRSFQKAIRQLGLQIPSISWTATILPDADEFLKNAVISIVGVPNGDTFFVKCSLTSKSKKTFSTGLCPALLGPIDSGTGTNESGRTLR